MNIKSSNDRGMESNIYNARLSGMGGLAQGPDADNPYQQKLAIGDSYDDHTMDQSQSMDRGQPSHQSTFN